MSKIIKKLMLGDCIKKLKKLPDESIHCVVTSPPYYGLRDYGHEGQIGLEQTPDEYVQKMVAVFREVWRVLRKDGTVWLNLGDSYATHASKRSAQFNGDITDGRNDPFTRKKPTASSIGLKEKDLIGIPWRVAFALQADGWYLRQDIIWHKPNPMPESVTDRCTKAHEYIFLLSKSQKYFYDSEAIKEPAAYVGCNRGKSRNISPTGMTEMDNKQYDTRNKRSVWTVSTKPFSGAHFAVFPEKLIEPCILAGTSEKGCCSVCGSFWVRKIKKGKGLVIDESEGEVQGRRKASGHKATDTSRRKYLSGKRQAEHKKNNPDKFLGWQQSCTCKKHKPISCKVLDPFTGSGTTGIVSIENGRSFIGIELNRDYFEMAKKRIKKAKKIVSLF